MMEPQAPYFPRFTVGRVDVNNDSLEHDIALRNFEFPR
jgi:hypothetical protein